MADQISHHDAPGDTGERLLEEFPTPTLEEWHQEVLRLLKGASFDKKMLTPTYEGITLRPMYTQDDVKDLPHVGTYPGNAPYVRGGTPLGHRLTSWEVAQELPYPSYEEFNQALLHDLERGQTAVNLVLDEATQAGLDPDMAAPGQVGQGGVSIASLIGLTKALESVDLEKHPIYVQAGSAALPFAALLIAFLRKRGVDPANLRGSIGLDPLCGLVEHGTLPLSLERAYDELALLTRWAKQNAPRVRTIAIYGHPYHNAGGSSVQELAFVLATAVEYLREMETRGLGVEDVAPRLFFGLSIGSNFFMETAKLRAARMLWSKIVRECGGDGLAGRMTIHARTSSYNKTAYDPYVNILRTTTEAFSAVMGGVESLHVTPLDEPQGLPSDFSRRIARNTQIILREECHLDDIIDPAGGSWYVESLTDEVAKKAWALFQEIEGMGGMAAALKTGKPQAMVAETAEQHRNALATRRDVLVGTNMYPNATETKIEANVPDLAAFHAKRSARLQELRTSSEHNEQIQVLASLQHIFESSPEETVEALIDAASKGATIGEFTKTLRHEDGETPKVEPVRIHRAAEIFEQLRDHVTAHRAVNGNGPDIFLANIGPVAGYMPRLDFARSFFQVGGFQVEADEWYENAEAAGYAALASKAPVVVIVSTDERYPDNVPELARALKQGRPDITVILAGAPRESAEEFRRAGVDEFIHLRSDVHMVLTGLAEKLGVKA